MKTSRLFPRLVFIGLLLFAKLGWASEPPYARTCRGAGGFAWSVDLSLPTETTLCVFETAAVGAPELALYRWENKLGLSLKALLGQSAQRPAATICNEFKVAQRISQDSEGVFWTLCVFPDGSVIEASTLARGVNSPANSRLVQALR